MTEDLLRAQFEQLFPIREEALEWADVVKRAEAPDPAVRTRSHRRRRQRLVLGVALAIAAVAAVSALAAAGVGPFASFRSWLSGEPGKPASSAARRAVLTSPYSWDAFPSSTNLRRLITVQAGGASYTLYGFRSGSELCLSLETSSPVYRGISPSCVSAVSLTRQRQPLVLMQPDAHLVGALNLAPEVSFGIVADAVTGVEVHAVDGPHRARVESGAYLWIETEPNTGNRVLSVSATTPTRPASVRLSATPYQLAAPLPRPALGPTRIQAVIRRPTIGWLDRKQPVGIAPSALTIRPMMRQLIAQSGFTRFIKPDPLSDVTVGVSAKRLFLYGGLWGGSNPPFFNKGPLHVFYPPRYDSLRFVRFTGIVADGVVRVRLFLADGETETAALRDNVFTALVPAMPPYRIVAYNGPGKVVASQTFERHTPQPTVPAAARTNLEPLLTVHGPHHTSATLSLSKNAARAACYGLTCSIRCWRVSFSNHAVQEGCLEQINSRSRRRPEALVFPYAVQPVGHDIYLVINATARVTRVGLRFKDGETIYARPTHGFALFAIPSAHLSRRMQRVRVIGYDPTGKPARHRQSVYFRSSP